MAEHSGYPLFMEKHFCFREFNMPGYGNYYHIQNNLENKLPGGDFSFQLWLSIGYYF